MKIHSLRNLDTLSGAAVLVLSGAAALGAACFPATTGAVTGPAVFPWVVSAGWALCGLALVVSGVRGARPVAGAEEKSSEPPVRRMLALLGLAVAYALLLPLLGFVSASALFLVLTMRFLGYRHLWRAGAISLSVAFVVFWLFATVMKVPLPAGWLG